MSKKIILLFFVFVLLLYPSIFTFAQPAQASFQSYSIIAYVDYNTLLLSRLSRYYMVDFSFECFFSSMDEGHTIQIDSLLYPSYGDDVVYGGGMGEKICTVSSFGNTELSLSTYTIQSVLDYNTLILSDSLDYYKVDFNYPCSFLSSDAGNAIEIDSSYGLGYGDFVVYNKGYSIDTCEVNSSTSLFLREYSIVKTEGTSKVLIKDSYNNQYLVQYGTGCLSLLNKSSGKIYIDIGSLNLDGIGDTIYLLEDGQECSVWDAEVVKDEPIIITPPPVPTPMPNPTPTPTPAPAPTPSPVPAPSPVPNVASEVMDTNDNSDTQSSSEQLVLEDQQELPQETTDTENNESAARPEKGELFITLDTIYSDTENNLELKVGKAITLKGKTVPNATVNLFIESDLLTATVNSDSDGNWEYTLSESLDAGEHTLYAEVVDENGDTLEKKELTKFAVTGEGKTSVGGRTILLILIPSLAIILFVLLVILKRKKQ